MKFSSEIIKETGTILEYSCLKEEEKPYIFLGLLSLFAFFSVIFKSLLILVIPVYLIWSHRNEVFKETLLIIKNLGVQITKSKRSGAESSIFIEHSEIREFVINESMSPYSVKINLGIIQVKSVDLIIPFSSFELSLAQAKQVYKGAREILFT